MRNRPAARNVAWPHFRKILLHFGEKLD